MTHWKVRRAFPRDALAEIEDAIARSEKAQSGQIRCVVEGALHTWPLLANQSPRERAVEVFTQLRIWDTEHNNGVLIYFLLADRAVEIVADRGINRRVSPSAWSEICRGMEQRCRAGHFKEAAVRGIQEVTLCLQEHFPASGNEIDELPNQPLLI